MSDEVMQNLSGVQERAVDTFWAVILGLHLIPVFGTLAGMIHEEQETRRIRGTCPACNHPEHWPWCRDCGCDLFTEPED